MKLHSAALSTCTRIGVPIPVVPVPSSQSCRTRTLEIQVYTVFRYRPNAVLVFSPVPVPTTWFLKTRELLTSALYRVLYLIPVSDTKICSLQILMSPFLRLISSRNRPIYNQQRSNNQNSSKYYSYTRTLRLLKFSVLHNLNLT